MLFPVAFDKNVLVADNIAIMVIVWFASLYLSDRCRIGSWMMCFNSLDFFKGWTPGIPKLIN